MGLLGHLARPLTPKSGAKAIVFLGRDNGLPWNAALAFSRLPVHPANTKADNRAMILIRAIPFCQVSK
jgi:hypothetical protein